MNIQNIPKDNPDFMTDKETKLYIDGQPTKRIIYADASGLKKSGCMRRVQWHIVDGYVPRGQGGWERNYKAGYGTSFHKVYQQILQGKPRPEAIQWGVDWYRENYEKYIPQKYEFRTPEHLESVLRLYYKVHNIDVMSPMKRADGGGYLSEIKFQYPYYEDETMVVYITGTVDLISSYSGRVCVTDHKVTGARDPDDFFFGFELDIQSRMYCWIYYTLTGQILPFLVNGVFIKAPTEKSMLKGIFDGVVFKRNTPIEMDIGKIKFFERWLFDKLNRVIAGVKAGNLADTYDLTGCHELFNSQCVYYNICRLDPAIHQQVLEGGYEKHPYNPLLFQD
jgi:hypothetical protein